MCSPAAARFAPITSPTSTGVAPACARMRSADLMLSSRIGGYSRPYAPAPSGRSPPHAPRVATTGKRIAPPFTYCLLAAYLYRLLAARLGPPRRGGRLRVVGPGGARVAATHLRAHRRVAAAPEPRQIARDLHGPVRRRQQLDHQRNPPARNGRMPRQAEQLLHPDGELGAFLRGVVDRDPRAGRRLEMRRRLAVQPPPQGV